MKLSLSLKEIAKIEADMTLQFVWWPRLQFWFVRDEKPLGFLYVWRLHIGPLEVRRLAAPYTPHALKKARRGQ